VTGRHAQLLSPRSSLTNFSPTFGTLREPLALLYPLRNAGILVFTSSFGLLERYLRGENGLTPKQGLDSRCWNTLTSMFPVLGKQPDAALDF
jgi:hypothetical protein